MKEIMKKRNAFFWGAYFIYLVATVFQTTMFNENAKLFELFVALRYLSFFIAGIKILLDLLWQYSEEKKNVNQKCHETIGCFIKYFIVFGVLFIVSYIADERSLLFVFILLAASRYVEVEWIFKYTLKVQIILFLMIIISSCVGIIPDLLFDRGGVFIRHALGYIYPSVAVNYFYFIITIMFWLRKDQLELKEAFLLEIINLLLFILTDVKTGFALITLIIIVEIFRNRKLWWKTPTKVNEIRDQLIKKKRIVIHIYDYCVLYLVGVLTILCLTIQCKPTQIINSFLTNRIQLVVNAVKNYGIHIWGQNIEWIGYGGNTDLASFEGIYNFVDCSYASIILNYGIIVFAGILVLVTITGKDLRKKRQYHKCFLYFMMLVYCFIEPRLIEIQVNTLLFIMAPFIYKGLPIKKIKNSLLGGLKNK